MKEKFELTKEEKHSALWRRLIEHWETKLADARRGNDADLSEIETAKQRGRIAEIKANLALDKEKPIVD